MYEQDNIVEIDSIKGTPTVVLMTNKTLWCSYCSYEKNVIDNIDDGLQV